MPHRVVLTRRIPEEGMKLLEGNKDIDLVCWPEDSGADRKWVLEQLEAGETEGVVVMLTDKVDEELLSKAPKLKVVSTMSAGLDHIDLPAVAKRKLKLGFTPDALTDAVADLSVFLALGAQRRAGESARHVLNGDWPEMPWKPLLLCGVEVRKCTVGFLGFGRIAQATLARLLSFGISKAVYMTSKPGQATKNDFFGLLSSSQIPIVPASSSDDLASQSDILFVCCALTDSTKGLVNKEFLSKMKSNAVVVNTARGPIVDNEALAEALRDGKIFGAGLDVVAGEPNIGADHPLVKEPRCFILPHVGSATLETRNEMARTAAQNLISALKGEKMESEMSL